MKRVLAVVAFSLLALSAQAEFDVRASIGSLSFELTDLDLNDGVSPSISFGGVYGYGSNSLYTEDLSDLQTTSFSSTYHQITRKLTNGPASAEFGFDGFDVGTFAMRSGFHSGLDVSTYNGTPPQERSSTMWGLNIEVSPRTLVKVFAMGKVEARADVAIGASTFSDTSVYANLRLSDKFGKSRSDQVAYSNFVSGDLVTFSEIRDKTLSVSLENGLGSVQTMALNLETWTYHSLTPIPEPSTVGLSVFGLLLLSLLSRLRRMN